MFTKTSRGFLCGLVALALVGPLAGPTAVAAEVLPDGRGLFAAQKCNMCHSVPQADLVAMAKSKKMRGPDMPAESGEPDWIVRYLKREIQLNGKDHKKEFKGTEEELRAIAAWLVTLKCSESEAPSE